jgi:4-amino-4-deoxy-L-arabinose transferase-like glycosyltransferase
MIIVKTSRLIEKSNSAILLYLLLLALGYASTNVAPYQPFFIIGIGLVFFAASNVYSDSNHRLFFLLILLFGTLLRFYYAISVPTVPFSDFEYYHSHAILLSQNEAVLPKNFGYVTLLSLGYRIYPEVITGKIINAVASSLSLLLVYYISILIFNKKTGLAAMFLLSILLSDINMVSVIGTESLAQTFLLASLFFAIKITLSNKKNDYYYGPFATGLIFGIGITIRSSLIFFIFCLLILFIIYIKSKVKSLASFLIGIFIGLILIVSYYSIIKKEISFEPLLTQESFPILSGTNYQSGGRYNLDDAEMYISWPLEERDNMAREVAIDRIKKDPLGLISILPRKMDYLFASNDYGITWSLDSIDWEKHNVSTEFQKYLIKLNGVISQSVYIIILCFAFIGSMHKEKPVLFSVLFFCLILSFIFPHFFLEVQPRYHHYLTPLIIPLAGYGLINIKNRLE